MMGKVLPFETLAATCQTLREQGHKVVLCHGCFDLLHLGHIRYLRQAALLGDVLIVTVTPDRYVDKGPNRPAFPEALRAEAVASLEMVAYVAVNSWPTAENTLRALRPDVYVKGSDFKQGVASDPTGKLAAEAAVAEEIGTTVRFTEEIVFSSTNLINRFFSSFSEEGQEYLHLFRQRFGLDTVTAALSRLANLKVLVIGDIILDEYQYCHALGTSTKEAILCVQHDSTDLFAGGVLAIANHLANFAGETRLFSIYGGEAATRAFITDHLHPSIRETLFVQDDAPTTVKRRFVDGYSMNKLFEVYCMDDRGLSPEKQTAFQAAVEEEIDRYDLVLAADFGHGCLNDALRRMLCDKARFLAVNTQANASNRGFHTIGRYPRCDYASLTEHELRLDQRNLQSDVHRMMQTVGTRLQTTYLLLTRGKKGCVARNAAGAFYEIPTFAQTVVDRVGAGDAFLSVASLLAANREEAELVGFVGNCAGSLAVNIVGNQRSIERHALEKFITLLLK
jgi:rfaE bifunctional protein kinase chain/domain/rfaE bifunctional protein nucleotidyltransferase chain/domain